MFRGGRVDARGTGITSNLGYNNGGRVGYFEDQQGGVVLGKDLIANNIFSGTPRSKDYLEKQQYYEKYEPKTLEDITADYNKLMQQKEDDLLMTMGIDDYSGFQNTVAEDLDYYRDPEGGMKKYFQDARAKDDAARKDATQYDVTIDEVINNQTEELPQELTLAQLENIELRKLLEERMSKGTPEEEIEKNKKIFQKAYGSGVADDASAMLMGLAGKMLKPEATVKSGFGEFFEDEQKRPSERKKYKDAATTAAINAYLTGQKDYDSMMKQMKLIQYGNRDKIAVASEAANLKGKDWESALSIVQDRYRGTKKRDSFLIVSETLKGVFGKPVDQKKGELGEIQEEDLIEGFTILTTKAGKIILEKIDGVIKKRPDLVI